MKPKILQIIADGAVGGGMNHVLQILNGLQSSYELGVLTQADSHLETCCRQAGIKVFTGNFMKSRLNPAAVTTIRNTIHSFQPNLIHCHGGRAAFFHSFVSTSVATLYTVHGYHFRKKTGLTYTLGRIAEIWSARRVAEMLFVCKFDQTFAMAKRLFPGSTANRVIYNGIAIPQVLPDPTMTGKIGFVGRLCVEKRPDLFVQMMALLPQLEGVIIGAGTMDNAVRQLIVHHQLTNRLVMKGSLPHENTLAAIAGLKILVMTSESEGLPLLILEAMALRVPVVSTAVGGIPEIIEHGISGLLTDNSPESLAAAVLRLTQDAALRAQLVNNAAERVHQFFAEQQMLSQISRVYDHHLGNAVGTPSNADPVHV